MRSRAWRVLLGMLVALVAAAVVVLVGTMLILWVPPVGRFALSQALTRGAPRFGASVRFGRIEGNVMRSITLTDLVAKLGPDSLKVRKLSLTYDPVTSIARRTFSASAASATEPQLFISSRRPAATGRDSGRTRYPSVRFGQFRLSGGSVYADSVLRLDSVNLTLNLVSAPERLDAQLSDVRARMVQEKAVLRNLGGSVRLTPDSLVVGDLVVATGASSLRGGLRMAFQPNAVALTLESLSISLPELAAAVPGGDKLPARGRLRATGVAATERGQPSASVRYAAEGLVVQQVSLPTISGKLGLEDSVLQLTMAGADSGLGSADVTGRLDLRELRFVASAQLAGIRARRFGTSLPEMKVDAEIAVTGRGIDSVAANVTARVPDFGIERLQVVGAYTRADKHVAIEQLELSGPVGTVSGRGTWQNNSMRADMQFNSFDLGVLSKFGSLPMLGRVSGGVRLAGTADTFDAAAELSVAGFEVAGFSATKARASVAAAAGRELSGQVQAVVEAASYRSAAVDSVRVKWQERQLTAELWVQGVQVAAEGSARLTRDSIGVAVSALRIAGKKDSLTFSDILRFGLRRDSLDLRLAAIGLAGGDVRVALVGAAGKSPRVDAMASRVDLARLKALFGLELDISGWVSFSVSGSDSFDVAVDAEQLRIPSADVALSRVQGTAHVDRAHAGVEHLWLVNLDSTSVPETSVVTGWLEYRTQGGFELGAVDLKARLRNPGTWVVFYLKTALELREGTAYGELALKGEFNQPNLVGRVRISRARLGVPVVGTTFDRVNAELVFDHSRIRVEKLSGRSDHGTSLVTGFVDLGRAWQVDSLRFHGDFTGTTINPMPEIYGTVGGSLDLGWTIGRPFVLSGTVNVEEALIALGFGQSASPGTATPDTSFVYDVRVRGDRNIWLRNQLADIELACDLTVRQTTREVSYSGELTSRQGSIYYLDHTLRVDSGSVRLENINTLNPDLHITASMPIRAVLDSVQPPDSVVVTLTGTLEKPSFEFRSVPPRWDESEVLSYLTLNATPEQLSTPTASKAAVNTLLSQRLLNYFQTQASKRARGFVNLDYLEVESSLLDTSKQVRVTVGKYVGRNLYVSYTQNITGITYPSFRVEYHIDRRNELVAEGTTPSTADEQYRTSLRYQFRLRY